MNAVSVNWVNRVIGNRHNYTKSRRKKEFLHYYIKMVLTAVIGYGKSTQAGVYHFF